MHIAIDARMYGTAQRGIGRYLIKLIENLEQVDSKNEYTIFLRRANFEEYQPKNPNFKKALWDVPWYGWREQVCYRALTKPPLNLPLEKGEKEGVDLWHFPHWNVPLFFNKPFVVTIHDLQLFSSSRVRESTTRGRLIYALKSLGFKIIFRHAVLAARAIIVPSNYVKDCLIAKYPQTREKIQVVYEAPTIEGIRNNESRIRDLIDGKYILYVGAAYPHKNLERLLKAWNIIHEKLPDYKLILVGREDFFWKKLKRDWSCNPSQPPLTLRGGESIASPLRVRGDKGVTNDVIFHGPATDDELAALYQNASLLVQPSLEEGFSLPPLEALVFKCPAVVSDIPVHHEILGEAALYFNPRTEHSIANTLMKAVSDKHTPTKILTHRTALLARYSWKKHAKETLALYETVLKV